jgi:hypothetical protein
MAISVANSRVRVASARKAFDCPWQASRVLVNAAQENQEFPEIVHLFSSSALDLLLRSSAWHQAAG